MFHVVYLTRLISSTLLLVAILTFLEMVTAESEDLSVVQASDIIAKIKNGEPIDYSYVMVNGDLIVSEPDMPTAKFINSPIKITDSIINGSINFDDTIMEELVNFRRTKFIGPVKFISVQFKGGADFERSQFDEQSFFINSTFSSTINFRYTKFNKNAIFLNAKFREEPDFSFSRFYEIASFRSVVFAKGANFVESTFENYTTFKYAQFDRANYVGAQFNDSVDFDFVQFNKSANFIGAGFNKDLYLSDVQFEKVTISWNSIKKALICNGASYIALIKNFKEGEQFEEADNCYYQYRERKRQSKPLGTDNILEYVAWLSCGYGVRWLNTILTAILVLILFAFYYESWNIMSLFQGSFLRKNIKNFDNHKFKQKLKNSMYFSIVMLLSLPSEWFPAGKEEFAKLLKLHMFSAVLERLIGWGLMLLLIGTLSRLMIRY